MELLSNKPGQKIIAYFALGVAVGTILLMLPFSATGRPVLFIDALFTATSAICVTGLTVLDTAKDFSLFGQVVIMLLIQMGGLGIMTFATILLMMTGTRLPFLDRLGLSQTFGTETQARSGQLLKAVFATTIIVEAIGAILLFLSFRLQFPTATAAYHAVFHSVAAFCNAGFSTFSSNLEGYRYSLPVTMTIALLIILGGLGFVVIVEILDRSKNKRSRLSLHSKLCISTTAGLLMVGTLLFVIVERGNVFARSGIIDWIASSFFQAVTARTAGFDTIPQASLTDLSLLITIFLMIVGTCPGSTGGGIKTTTFAIIALLLYNRVQGRHSVAAFKRTITPHSIVGALNLLLLALLLITVMCAALMFFEHKSIPHTASQGLFMESLFEVVSAFGTVGLSAGLTPKLHVMGKLTLVITMFIGRVGLLTFAYSLARPAKQGEIVYLDEPVMIG